MSPICQPIWLPDELWHVIFTFLAPRDRVVLAAVCETWFVLNSEVFNDVVELCLLLTDDQHYTKIISDTRGLHSLQLTVAMCQCNEHLHAHIALFSAILRACNVSLRQLSVDDMLTSQSCASDTLQLLLKHDQLENSGKSKLRLLQFDDVDLCNIDMNAIVPMIARRKSLAQLAVNRCQASPKQALPLLTRFYSSLVDRSLTELHVTASTHVTDDFIGHVSRVCPCLWLIDVRDCVNVTARGVAAFCRTINQRKPHLTHMQMGGTSVDGCTLRRHLYDSRSPLASSGPWSCTPLSQVPHQMMTINIHAYTPLSAPAQAVIIQTAMVPHKTLLISA